jgi:5-methylcytosine-specific restriction endonuclease McrA
MAIASLPAQEPAADVAADSFTSSDSSGGAAILDSNVLVLNRFYMALRVVSVRRAMTLLYRQCAEVITLENDRYASYDFPSWQEISQLCALEKQPGEDYLQAIGFQMLVPRIIRLVRFDRVPAPAVRFNRKNLFARDRYTCQYCGQEKPAGQLSLDHVVPRSHGGRTTWENIVCSCLRCNSRKGGRTPQQARMQLLSIPAKPKVNPQLAQTVDDPRYACWKSFLPIVG